MLHEVKYSVKVTTMEQIISVL